jgi:hypothetical protein
MGETADFLPLGSVWAADSVGGQLAEFRPQLAALCLVIAGSLLAWRLWVGVKPKGRWPILGLFASTFLLIAGSRLVLDTGDITDSMYSAAGAYTACLLVTRGRPERMLEVWKVTGEELPSREARRSVTLHQIAFCVLLVGGLGVQYWAIGSGI